MAVSSLKGCWYKLSARIRDYLDVVDSYYRPADELDAIHQHDLNYQQQRKYLHQPASSHGDQHIRAHGKRLVYLNNSKKTSDKHNHYHHKPYCTQVNACANNKRPVSSTRSQLLQIANGGNGNSTAGYSKRKTPQGQVYFLDPSGHKHWFDPSVPKELLNASLDLNSLVGRLSSTWEVRQTSKGQTYYVNHIKKTTQFTDPRLVAYKDHLMSILKHIKCTETNPLNSCSQNHTNNLSTASTSSNNRYQSSANRQQSSNPYSNNFNTNSNPLPQPPPSAFGGAGNKNCQDCLSDETNTISRMQTSHLKPQFAKCFTRHDLIHAAASNEVGPRVSSTNIQYHRNLLSGSHHNLNTMTNHSTASLTRPQVDLNGRTRRVRDAKTSQQHDQLSATTGRTPTNLAAFNNSLSRSMNRSGSINNLFSTSADNNIENNHNSSFDQCTLPYYPRDNKELFDKMSILRQELLKQQVIAHPCRIDINRKRIFEESFRVVTQMQPKDLKKRLLVKFRGEEGLDYGGVAREWFYLLSREILNPVHGLFQYTSDDIYNLQINPDSGIVYREHLSYLNFCGRVIGMAVFHGHFIEGHFTIPFYKMLLNKPITLDDIELVDPDLYRSLCWILDNDITNVIDTTFLVHHNAFGELQEHELTEGGRNIVVTEGNKHEYVSLYVNYRCRRGIESQFEALQRGFHELISPSLLNNFDEYELELLIGGLSKIDIEDWRLHTKLKNCTVETPLVRWFWEIVKSYSEDKRARLLQFVTGSPRVPIQGFKALQGVNSELRLFTIHLIRNACTDNLPKSHTCFNRIDLPPYETFDKLRDKLTQAIEETMGFAMQ